jgi:hypothetical protein
MKRPWGHFDRWAKFIDESRCSLLCSASFEDRCSAALHLTSKPANSSILRITPPERSRFREELIKSIDTNFSALNSTLQSTNVFNGELLDPPAEFSRFLESISTNWSESLMIDMSCIPKRYLCLIIAEAVRNIDVKNIYVGYSIPKEYTSEPLSEDQLPICAFPAFARDELIHEEPTCVIAGVGYMSFDLDAILQTLNLNPKTSILFPFPPGAPSLQRSWKSLLKLVGEANDFGEPIRVDARDTPYAFEVLDELTNQGSSGAYLLPFGPKPHALAMILHSIYRKKSELLYTQPQTYHPQYSTGLRELGGRPEIYVYSIRLDGENLYEMTNEAKS